MMTHWQPAAINIGALISPVNAPLSLGYRFCPAMPTRPPASRTVSATEAKAVNGGATTTSTLGFAAAVLAMACASSQPSGPPRFSFQLPAIRGLRSLITGSSKRFDSWHAFAGHECHRCIGRQGHVVELGHEFGAGGDRRHHSLLSGDYAEAGSAGDTLQNRERTGVGFRCAHGTRIHDRFCSCDPLAEALDGFRTDVQRVMPGRDPFDVGCVSEVAAVPQRVEVGQARRGPRDG